MTIEETIKDTVNKKLNDGTVEKLVSEAFEKCLKSALENAFSWNNPAKKAIEAKLEEVLVPALESYDYSSYIPKLDAVLTEIINSTALVENKKILSNFSQLMIEPEKDEIKLSELVQIWTRFVASHVETEGLEVCYDDDVSYEAVNCTMAITEPDNPTWYHSIYEKKQIVLECEHDEEMNFIVPIRRYKAERKDGFEVDFGRDYCVSGLRHMKDFEITLLKLSRAGVRVLMDIESYDDCIVPEKEPEATFM